MDNQRDPIILYMYTDQIRSVLDEAKSRFGQENLIAYTA